MTTTAIPVIQIGPTTNAATSGTTAVVKPTTAGSGEDTWKSTVSRSTATGSARSQRGAIAPRCRVVSLGTRGLMPRV